MSRSLMLRLPGLLLLSVLVVCMAVEEYDATPSSYGGNPPAGENDGPGWDSVYEKKYKHHLSEGPRGPPGPPGPAGTAPACSTPWPASTVAKVGENPYNNVNYPSVGDISLYEGDNWYNIVWWTFTPDVTGAYRVDNCDATTDTLMYVSAPETCYQRIELDSVGGVTPLLVYQDDPDYEECPNNGEANLATFYAIAGKTYHIAIAQSTDGEGEAATLTIAAIPAPRKGNRSHKVSKRAEERKKRKAERKKLQA